MEIRNFLVVRFSLKVAIEWQRKAYGDESNRSRWLRMRASLFNKTMLRSALDQTVKPEAVFLLLDEGDTEFYFSEFGRETGMLVPIFSVENNFADQVSKMILKSGPENVAVSRIDSDDVIAVDYLDKLNNRIRSAIAASEIFEYVVAPHGYRTNFVNIQEIYYNCSPFLTMFKKYWDGGNIYSFNHEHVVKFPHILAHDALWMQCLHGTNISNGFLAQPRDSRKAFEEDVEKNVKFTSMKQLPVSEFWPSQFNKIQVD